MEHAPSADTKLMFDFSYGNYHNVMSMTRQWLNHQKMLKIFNAATEMATMHSRSQVPEDT